ncbi:AMIN domain-containing protein [candidate division WOR-3 bacterium]|nr:AMIN domain-containing protein [candidate division WOR-3 bacterium]
MNRYTIVVGGLSLFLLAGQICSTTVDGIEVAVTDRGVVVSVITNATEYREVQVPLPPRIVIDFPNSKYRVSKNRIDVGKGDLIAVRSGQFKPDITRVVLDLRQKREYSIQKTKTGFEILLIDEENIAIEKKGEELEIKRPQEKETFLYSARGKRDPFKPLVGWALEEDPLLDVRDAQVVGIVWSPEERYAIIQARDGKVYIVEEGDRVREGEVSKIGKKEVVFTLFELGRTERLTVKIKEKEL